MELNSSIFLLNQDINQIVFTGSVETGQAILRSAAERAIPCVMELGGKSAGVVFPDADLAVLEDSIDWGIFFNAGQVCSAGSRLYIHESRLDDMLGELRSVISEMTMAPGLSADCDIGPVISSGAKSSIETYIQTGLDEGAEIAIQGEVNQTQGYFLPPTVLLCKRNDMTVVQEEIFGPARAVVRAKSLHETIKMINDHKYGNGASIFTRDGGVAREFYENVEAGGIGINVPVPACSASHNFGGLKNSRYGESFLYGPDSARFFTKEKTVSSRWNTSDNSDVFVSMYTES